MTRLNFLPFDGEAYLFLNAVPDALAALLRETPWQQDQIRIAGRTLPLPRLTAWYGDAPYHYSGILMQPHPWTPLLSELKTVVETLTGNTFNAALLNYYRDGQDSVAWHSDDEPELGENPSLASVSFGATRRFSLKHRHRKDTQTIHLDLLHRSVLLMQGKTQHQWLHQMPKTRKPVGERVNLTFRTVYSQLQK